MIYKQRMLLRITRERKFFRKLLCQCYHTKSDKFESNVRIPRKKIWSDTAVLQTLCDSITADPLKNAYYPLYSVDMHPNSKHQENILRQCNTKGLETAKFVISNNPQLSNLEWKTDQHHELDAKPTELPSSKNETSGSELEDLMDENSYEELCNAYMELIAEGSEISQELNEKVIAFLAFHLKKDKIETFWRVVQSAQGKLTKHCYMSIVRGYSQQYSYWKAITMFANMIDDGHSPDSKTTDMLLSCLVTAQQNANLLDRFVAAWKHHGVKPTPLAIGVLGFGFDRSEMKERNAINLWGKCLSEMRHCDVALDLNMLSSMLRYVCHVFKNETIIWAILEVTDHTPILNPSHTDASPGFCDAMVLAFQNNNVQLANRLYQTVRKLELKGVIIRDPRRAFYTNYLILLCREGTMESFIQTASDLIFKKIFYSPSLSDGLMKACVMRDWPQVLPFLFQYLDRMLYRDLRYFTTWLAAARVLIDRADADTLIQMKNISRFLLGALQMNFGKSEADFVFSSICIIIAKSGDKAALVNTLTEARKFYSRVGLQQDAIEICANGLGSKVPALEPYMR